MSERKSGLNSSRLIVNATASILVEILGMSVLLWVNQYLLRRISPEEYALIPIVTALMFFAEFFRIIFSRGMGRFMVEQDARGDSDGVTRITSSMLPVLLGVAGFVGLMGALAIWKIDRVITVDPDQIADARLMLGLLVATFCLGIASTPLASGLYVKLRLVEHHLIDLAMELLRIGLLLGLLFGVGAQAKWVIVAGSTAGICGILIRLAVTRRILPAAHFRWQSVSGPTMRTLLSFSLWTSVQSLTTFVQRGAPALLLNRYSSAIDVASFHIGNLPNLQIQKLIQAASVASTQELTTLYAREGEAALRPLYYRGGRYYLWGSLFLLPPLIAYARELMLLYAGETYWQAAIVLALVLAIHPFSGGGAMYQRFAYAVGRIRAYNSYSIALSVAGLALMYLFVAVFDMGAVGAALGLAAGFALVHVLLLWPMGLRMVQGNWRSFLSETLLRGLTPFLLTLLGCLGLAQAVDINSWLRFALGCLFAAGLYALILGLCLDAADRALIGRKLAGLRVRLRGAR